VQPLSTIQPLPRLTLFEALAAQIEELILSGQLEAGAKLPSEEVLRREFAVSRPVVREALGRLRERGLIETVNGSGTFVKHPDADHLTDTLVRHLRVAAGDSGSVVKVYEARIAIETATARLAAARASEHDLEQIAACLEAMRSERGDVERWTAADLGFHLAVASACHNPFLSTMLAPLVKVIERGIIESFASSEAVEAGLRAHEQIWQRIHEGDARGAEEAMRRHLIDSERRFALARFGTRAGPGG
jgi:GntR family transcriptional regulator, transcriptional repressor for pyruvate dehydrogenase complex